MISRKKKLTFVSIFIFLLSLHLTSPIMLAEQLVLRSGTYITLEFLGTISSETHNVGQVINLSVVNDIKVNNYTVIPAGTLAEGKIISANSSGIVGQPGSIGIQITKLNMGGGNYISLSASRVIQGANKTAVSIVLTILCIFGLLLQGGDAEFQAGSTIDATTVGDAYFEI